MKKTLLLSVVASTLIMAGGDIEPVEVPVVEEVVSGWDFSGQAVLYYQSWDRGANADMFDKENSRANSGIQLRAINTDIAYGIGAGVEVSGLATLGLQDESIEMVQNTMQGTGGWISQAYLTYGFGNTSFKLGRQELPKSLSPFAFSEGWNVFKNTFDAALVVNTDIADTTLVGAWVAKANFCGVTGDIFTFAGVNNAGIPSISNAVEGTDKGIFMATIQNKSVEALTVTGTWYYADAYGDSEFGLDSGNAANILWADAKYSLGDYALAGQIGTVMSDYFTTANGMRTNDDTMAYGLKAGGNFGMFDASLAYSYVDNGGIGVFNVGGVKTPLYTQMIFNQDAIKFNSSTFVARAGYKALGGKFGIAYGYSDMGAQFQGSGLINGTNAGNRFLSGEYSELDLTYKTKVFNDTTTLFAGYIYQDRTYDIAGSNDFSDNTLRLWGRYNF